MTYLDRRELGRATVILVSLLGSVLLLGGCGLLSEPEVATPTATVASAQLVPTFTPTPVQTATPTPDPPTDTPVVPTATSTPVESADEGEPVDDGSVDEGSVDEGSVDEDPVSEEPADPPTPAPVQLTVTGDVVNVRRGPGTEYGIVGSADAGMQFDVLARNSAGDWYQFCCVNGEEGWIYGDLVDVNRPNEVALAQDIPAPPPTNTPAPQPPPASTPEPQQPEPEQPEPEQPQPAADPCANIGGDGCKFRITGGPSFGDNGGLELSLRLFFIHSGVGFEGGSEGQPQGSYFLWLEKDGQRLPVPDSVRSTALQRHEGALGPYNYEYKMGTNQLPGNRVAGSYQGWVLDGNGERDSQTFTFTVPENQGEVWIQFDQN